MVPACYISPLKILILEKDKANPRSNKYVKLCSQASGASEDQVFYRVQSSVEDWTALLLRNAVVL